MTDNVSQPVARRSRLRPSPNVGISLTPRKVRVIVAVFLNRAMRGDQLDCLFSSVKTRNESLRLMFDHGYLSRSFPAASHFGAPVYHVGKAGVPVAVSALAEAGLELTGEDVRALCRKPALTQLEHSLRISDVYAAFCLRDGYGVGVSIREFLPEQLVRCDYEVRKPDTQKWHMRRFAPDGALVVSLEGGPSVVLFLEIDLGSVDLVRFAKKCQAFQHVAGSGLATESTGTHAAALAVVTVSDARLARLRRIADEQGCPDALLSTLEEIRRMGRSARWSKAGSAGSLTLFEYLSGLEVQTCSV
jgi:hypothetical protein